MVTKSVFVSNPPPLYSHYFRTNLALDTWSHPYMTAVQSESVFAELYYTVSNHPLSPSHRLNPPARR